MLLATALLAAAALTAPLAPPTDSGAYLYIARGCLGCHGASARGGVGPQLAQTGLAEDAFLRQLRQPRGIMPTFPHEVVSDGDARAIYRYLQAAPAPAARLRTDVPRGVQTPQSCAPCHERLQPGITRQYRASAMGRAGTQNPRVANPSRQIDCAACHGTDHDVIMASLGRVPETTCQACHLEIYTEHVTDNGHSYGPGPGTLGSNWERNIGVPHYRQMPRVVMEMGCDPCHAQAGATDARYWSDSLQRYTDTSSLPMRNGCVACHTRHAFNLEEARKPEACYTCHMGPDHPNYEAYMSSKHGAIYAARGRSWDWNAAMPQATYETPTCAYCHMVYVDSTTGARRTSHNMTRKIIWGMGVQPAVGQLEDITVLPENRGRRDEMIRVCITCHSEDRARSYLSSADGHKLAGDALVIEARTILAGLYADGLIEPSHGQTSAGLLAGPRFTAVDLGEMAAHSPASTYYDVTPIEREYFDMFFFSALKSYKGAFHMSPDYAWWYGYAETLGHLATIRNEAHELRANHATRNRTLFMILTGPLMVLLVMGAVFWGWRWKGRRA